jgi:two-component system sensor histidine kinase KdpD
VSVKRRPEDFLALVERNRRGRLKLYIGFAPGVGKTYRMLEEAHALKARGVDVVLAFVETHGRAETVALLDGLEQVPRRRVEYRGVTIEEMDVDAVLARKPAIAIVDELPHTNPPDAKNRKRYQDVLDLLAAGVHVMGALNIQHIESLRDLIERVTGVVVRETVPDRFVKEADQVVNLDLAIEDLVERLRAGKIYAPEKIERALELFIQDDKLLALRELALREVAESIDRVDVRPDDASWEKSARARLVVAMSSLPAQGAALLRKGSRLAGKLATDWFVLYVETPEESPTRIDAEVQRRLLANIALAHDLGAEVVRLHGTDPVAVILDFARSHRVGHIVVGRSGRPFWRQLLGLSVPLRLVREAEGIDVHIVSLEVDEEHA